ncbi:MAG: hypothetical protein V1913_12440 [Fibrobacterota bacterium]
MYQKLIPLAIALMFTLAAAQAVTNDPADQDKNVKAADVAKEYGTTEVAVKALKDKYSIGYGGVSKALALSAKSGLTVDEILKMKTEEKMGWGQIEKHLDMKANKKETKADKQEIKADKTQLKADKAELKADKAEHKAERKAEKAEKAQTK